MTERCQEIVTELLAAAFRSYRARSERTIGEAFDQAWATVNCPQHYVWTAKAHLAMAIATHLTARDRLPAYLEAHVRWEAWLAIGAAVLDRPTLLHLWTALPASPPVMKEETTA